MKSLGARQRHVIKREADRAARRLQPPKPKRYRSSSALAEDRRDLKAELAPLRSAMKALARRQRRISRNERLKAERHAVKAKAPSLAERMAAAVTRLEQGE